MVALALAPVPGRNNSHGNELRRDVATGESGFQFASGTVISKFDAIAAGGANMNDDETHEVYTHDDGRISAYDGHRIKHLSHDPITNRTVLSVVADYENRLWSLWIGEQQVVKSAEYIRPN